MLDKLTEYSQRFKNKKQTSTTEKVLALHLEKQYVIKTETTLK